MAIFFVFLIERMATIQDVKRIAKQLSKKAVASKQDVLTLDTTPQADSARPLTSGAVHNALAGKQDTINPNNELTDKAVVFNNSGNLAGVLSVTSSNVGHLSGTTSNIQSQIDSKQSTITNSITSPDDDNFSLNVSTTGLLGTTKSFIFKTNGDFQDGNGNLLSEKQNTITAGTNLSFNGNTLNAASPSPSITASRVCVSDGNGDLTASSITTTELDRLDGINFNIKSGIDSKITGGVRIDNLGFTGTTNSGNEWNVRISGGRTNANN